MSRPAGTSGRWFLRLRLWARRTGLYRKLAIGLAIASLISALATFATMSSGTTWGTDPQVVLILLYVDLFLLLGLGAVVARRVAQVWGEKRRGMAGSRLHVRLVMLFSLVAATPAVLVAVFAGIFLNFGVQAWFGEKVKTVVSESRAVAEAYLHEHQLTIRADALAMANDLNRDAPFLARNQSRMTQWLEAQAGVRSLPEAAVIDSSGRVLARTTFSLSLNFDLVPATALREAHDTGISLMIANQDDRVRALVRLNRIVDAYLLVGRFVESRVLNHIEQTEGAYTQYKQLEKRRKSLQVSFVMIFVLVALLLLLAAVWIGLLLANRIVSPISNLILAAERVGQGDLSARVDPSRAADEISILSRSFNRMTAQLESQQEGLIVANRELDERRQFTETVLAGVSAGVIGLDPKGNIDLPNRSARDLLQVGLDDLLGRPLVDIAPEMGELLTSVMERPERQREQQIEFRRNSQMRTLLVRIAAERHDGRVLGFVVTFDDISELLQAQRQAAWADVARRIAHEIKNPLTPIQLSAERLKRKYGKEIQSDPATFLQCTDTIIRQVSDIGRMVDEFSSFARMPEPTMRQENLSEVASQVVFLERNRHPEIVYELDLPPDPVRIRFDTTQVSQAITNLVKNAAESISERAAPEDGSALPEGRIRVSIRQDSHAGQACTMLSVADNGKGFPKEQRQRLTEPYVTTRAKGTGLGLAIVKKIMEDHGGTLILEDAPEGGAQATLALPLEPTAGNKNNSEAPVDPMTVATRLTIDGG